MKRWLRIGVSGMLTGTASSRRARSAGTVVGIVLALVSAIEPGPGAARPCQIRGMSVQTCAPESQVCTPPLRDYARIAVGRRSRKTNRGWCGAVLTRAQIYTTAR
jgi:hypothetical protein